MRVLHYLFTPSKNKCIAHCLDLDIAASAVEMKEVERRLDVLVKNYIETALNTGNYSLLSNPAPESFWESFRAGTRVEPNNPKLSIRVPDLVPTPRLDSEIGVLASQALAA